MKKKLLLAFFTGFILSAYAQGVDLDREYVSSKYIKLPTDPILDNSIRTYDVKVLGAIESEDNARYVRDKIRIPGYSKLAFGGTLNLVFNVENIKFGSVEVKKTKDERKDDDGNVISTKYYYHVEIPYSIHSTIEVFNNLKGESYTKGHSKSKTFSSKKYESYNKASDYYNNNRLNLKNNFEDEFLKEAIEAANEFLTSRYGYQKYENRYTLFWILSTKKHPEYSGHQEAYADLKSVFEKMTYEGNFSDYKAELLEIINYFDDLVDKYPDNDRKSRKLKYSSYFNISQIYYYLDDLSKSDEYAQRIVDNDYDRKDGEEFLKRNAKLKELFELNEVNSRHFEVITENLSETEEINEESPSNSDSELEGDIKKAYLITKEKDTLLVDIPLSEIKNINYSIKTTFVNDEGKLDYKIYKADQCLELVFVDGLKFKNISFKESSIKNGEVDAAQMLLGGASDKLCEVLHESDKINLYLFNDKELVFMLPEETKGKSTMSAGFVFGFRKNLSKFAKNCESVKQAVENKKYENTRESLLEFCNDLVNCEDLSEPK